MDTRNRMSFHKAQVGKANLRLREAAAAKPGPDPESQRRFNVAAVHADHMLSVRQAIQDRREQKRKEKNK